MHQKCICLRFFRTLTSPISRNMDRRSNSRPGRSVCPRHTSPTGYSTNNRRTRRGHPVAFTRQPIVTSQHTRRQPRCTAMLTRRHRRHSHRRGRRTSINSRHRQRSRHTVNSSVTRLVRMNTRAQLLTRFTDRRTISNIRYRTRSRPRQSRHGRPHVLNRDNSHSTSRRQGSPNRRNSLINNNTIVRRALRRQSR